MLDSVVTVVSGAVSASVMDAVPCDEPEAMDVLLVGIMLGGDALLVGQFVYRDICTGSLQIESK